MSEEKINLGQAPERAGSRDAVHVAVVGAVTAHRMTPGSRVGLNESGELSAAAEPVVGIVDPFLPGCEIPKGATVWLCLLPGTVTGMRHVWSAPGFEVKPPAPVGSKEKVLEVFGAAKEADPLNGFRFPEPDRPRKTRLSADDKLEILKLHLSGKTRAEDIGAMYGVTGAYVYPIVKQWKELKEAEG